jgi:predicted Zn-dependent protease
VKRRWIITVCLLLASGTALAWLQWHSATGEITPRPLLNMIADAQRQIERIPLGLTRVNPEEENEIGREMARRYGGSPPAGQSGDEAQRITEYLNAVGQRLAANVKRKAIRYNFHYIDDASFVNAFALPGGQIFFGRGLLNLLETEDELASILGHEIAHVDARHCIERLQYELKSRKIGLGGLYRLGRPAVMIFQAGYTKEQEAEADRLGLETSVAAGYSPAGAIRVMERFAQLSQGVPRQHTSPIGEIASVPKQTLQEYFRSHPPPRERIAFFEKMIAERGWDAKAAQRPLALRELFVVQEAAELAGRGLYLAAIRRYEEALRLNPESVPAWEGLASAHWGLHNADAALRAATEALKRQPGLERMWSLVGQILIVTDTAGAPARLARMTRDLSPPPSAVYSAWERLTQAAWRAGEAAATAEAAEQALRLKPDTAENWVLLARALAAAKGAAPAHFAQIQKQLIEGRDESVRISRDTELLVQVIAVGLDALSGRIAGVDAFWQRNPTLGAATEARLRRELGWWLHRAGKLNEAVAQFDAARQRVSSQETQRATAWVISDIGRQTDARAWYVAGSPVEDSAMQALIAWRQDEFDSARGWFASAVKAEAAWLEPRWVANNYSAASAKVFRVLQAGDFDRTGNFARAIELYRMGLRDWPESVGVWQGLARASWRSGDANETVRAATETLLRNVDLEEMWELLARALGAADPRGGAARFERTMRELKPAEALNMQVSLDLAGLRFLAGDARGMESYRQLRGRASGSQESAESIRRMAWWMYRAGKLREAWGELENSRRRNFQDAATIRLLAWVESDLGNQERAETHWRDSRSGPDSAEHAALESLIQRRKNQGKPANEAFQRAAQQDPVWMTANWPANNYSPAAARVFAELRTSEIARRRDAEQRARQGGVATPAQPSGR